MAFCSSYFYSVIFSFLFFNITVIINISHVKGCFTSIFSFGDSLADTGNLHQLSVKESSKPAHFDFPPYGRSFFGYPTGRCSDGRLVIDFIAESLGFPYLPPYFRGDENGRLKGFEKGVNFAFVGATALDDAFFKQRGIINPFTNVTLGVELGFFKHALPSLCSTPSDCEELLKNSLIVMGEIGGNDYNHAFLEGKNSEEIREFVPLVTRTIASAINELIELGAVTFLVPGNFPIGCSPAYLTYFQDSSDKTDYDPLTGCITWLNQFSEYHNQLLQTRLNQIRELHPHVNIIYADYYNIAMQFYLSKTQFGFKTTLTACCGGGGPYNYSSSVECGEPPLTTSCDDPCSYVSWDGLHYTEATYKWVSKAVLQTLYNNISYRDNLCSFTNNKSTYS